MAARMTEQEYADYLSKVGTREPHFEVAGRALCRLVIEKPSATRDEDPQWPEVRCPKCLIYRPRVNN
jgi:hypothetical protein